MAKGYVPKSFINYTVFSQKDKIRGLMQKDKITGLMH